MNQELRDFVKPGQISKHLYCSICTQVFNEPTRILCQHTFCYYCLTNWMQNNNTCPECRQKIDHKYIQKDLIAFKIINEQEVFCKNKKNCCNWKGPLSNIEMHLKNCDIEINGVPEFIEKKKLQATQEQQEDDLFMDEKLRDKLNENIPQGDLLQRLYANNKQDFKDYDKYVVSEKKEENNLDDFINDILQVDNDQKNIANNQQQQSENNSLQDQMIVQKLIDNKDQDEEETKKLVEKNSISTETYGSDSNPLFMKNGVLMDPSDKEGLHQYMNYIDNVYQKNEDAANIQGNENQQIQKDIPQKMDQQLQISKKRHYNKRGNTNQNLEQNKDPAFIKKLKKCKTANDQKLE